MRHRVSALVVTAGACLIAAALGPQPAGADGLPVYEVDTSRQGIETSSATARYVALPAGEGTSVARIDADGGRVRRSTFLEGDFTVPAVAYDGTTSGLSHDGKVLALIEPRKSFPRPTTGFVLLDAERMRTLEQVRLDGDFSFDAISPNGETIYLIEYLDRRDPTNYRVRAYDVDRGSLVAGAIVDPREPPAEMAGLPATRAVSPEGRWAYTLYQRGGGDEPFIHALDTRRGEAVCIDLEGFASRVMGFELLVAPGDGQLTLSDGQAEP
ncbi:MAG: hypothetical protein H0W09_08005, partial [Solirubrobacterales bacterium]|nr:hypothetical protein [Solirubrobacterales bacterium]